MARAAGFQLLAGGRDHGACRPATQPAAAPFRMADLGENAPAAHRRRSSKPAWNDCPRSMNSSSTARARACPPGCAPKCGSRAMPSMSTCRPACSIPTSRGCAAGLARRDNFSNEQDWISIAIDPVGTRRVAQLFYFNPDGVVWDGLSNEDAGTATSAADFEVEVATRIDADSWVVELRIPFEELRYASRTPENWHLLVRRNYPREERHAMAAPAIPANAPCFMCLAAPVQPPGELPSPKLAERRAAGRRARHGADWAPATIGTPISNPAWTPSGAWVRRRYSTPPSTPTSRRWNSTLRSCPRTASSP